MKAININFNKSSFYDESGFPLPYGRLLIFRDNECIVNEELDEQGVCSKSILVSAGDKVQVYKKIVECEIT